MIDLIDYWQLEREGFVGAGCLGDAAEQRTTTASMRAVARLFVLRAAAGQVDGLTAASYYAALLAVEDPEAGALRRCLLAIGRNDTAALSMALGEAARLAASHLAPRSARSFAELAYEAALEVGAWEQAHFAARILERLATMEECPFAAARWSIRADRQLRRVGRGTPLL